MCLLQQRKKRDLFTKTIYVTLLRNWLNGVLPMVSDRELTAQEKCATLLEEIILCKMVSYERYELFLFVLGTMPCDTFQIIDKAKELNVSFTLQFCRIDFLFLPLGVVLYFCYYIYCHKYSARIWQAACYFVL